MKPKTVDSPLVVFEGIGVIFLNSPVDLSPGLIGPKLLEGNDVKLLSSGIDNVTELNGPLLVVSGDHSIGELPGIESQKFELF